MTEPEYLYEIEFPHTTLTGKSFTWRSKQSSQDDALAEAREEATKESEANGPYDLDNPTVKGTGKR